MKTNNRKIAKVGILFLMMFLLILLIVVVLQGGKTEVQKEVVGLILPGTIEEDGFNKSHYDGAKTACENLGIELETADCVKDDGSGEMTQEVERMANEGIKIILLGSASYVDELKGLLDQYPDITFYCLADGKLADNYVYYFSKLYQARYLSGLIAGMTTKSDKIGYVAAMPTCEVNRGINAFTLGVREANPDAKVYVMFSDSWSDEEVEKAHATTLIDDLGVDVITYHQNTDNVLQVAEEKDIYAVGFYLDTEGYSDKVLTSVKCDWSVIYQKILQDNYQNGGPTKQQFWIGVEDGAVYLDDYSPYVTGDMENLVSAEMADIVNGIDVFSGEIYDNEGNIRCHTGETMSDDYLINSMTWYVDGVEIYEE